MEQNKQIKSGEWFCAIEGIAIAEKIHDFFYEEYDDIPEGKKLGDYKYSMVEYKLFCDFDGRPIKRNRNKIYRKDWCDPIDLKYQRVLNKSIKDNPKEYSSFVKFLNTKKTFGSCKTLYYELSPDNKQKVIQDIERIKCELSPRFTFQDMLKVASKNKSSIDLTRFESNSFCIDIYLEIRMVYVYGDYDKNRLLFQKFEYKICE